eukprot:2616688-Amphidinium_carterae.1
MLKKFHSIERELHKRTGTHHPGVLIIGDANARSAQGSSYRAPRPSSNPPPHQKLGWRVGARFPVSG